MFRVAARSRNRLYCPFTERRIRMSTDSTVKIVAAILLVAVLVIIVMRRKGKKSEKTEEDDF
jgi:hypothetical protein